MSIDTTPSRVATNALQAIPFSSLIGGPLKACIEAEAMAAKTTWEFIQQVGLQQDPITLEKKAVNVTFQYQKNGVMTNLVVPLLTIVPIPYIAVDTITIDFKANISASSSSVREDSSHEDVGGEAKAHLSYGWGIFSVSADFKANYSSKKDSKATEDSKYSVEYTMDVHVGAGQSSMPAGLATVLNILQSSITDARVDGHLDLSPKSANLDGTNVNKSFVILELKAFNSTGLIQKKQKINVTIGESGVTDPGFKIEALKGTGTGTPGTAFEAETDENGVLAIQVTLTAMSKQEIVTVPVVATAEIVDADMKKNTNSAKAVITVSPGQKTTVH